MRIKKFCETRIWTLIAVAAFAGSQIVAAFAAESVRPMPMGGLEFEQRDFLSIESEEVRVSSQKITVSYIFRSTAQKSQFIDIRLVPAQIENTLTGGAKADGWKEHQLKIQVEGKPVDYSSGVFVGDIEVGHLAKTGLLKDKDIEVYFTLDAHTKDVLQSKGVGLRCSKDNSLSCRLSFHKRRMFYWRQQLKPGDTRIEISYKPRVGGPYRNFALDTVVPEALEMDNTSIFREDMLRFDERNEYPTFRELYCMDKDVVAGVNRKARKTGGKFSAKSVFYLFDTVDYWQDPVKNFKLVIEKDHPNQIVSFCPNVASKTSSTTFEWSEKGFVPRGRLRVLFVD